MTSIGRKTSFFGGKSSRVLIHEHNSKVITTTPASSSSTTPVASSSSGAQNHRSFLPAWLDMYAAPPAYEYPSFTSYVGIVFTIITVVSTLFYVAVTLRDYVLEPPELVLQGTEALPIQYDTEKAFPIPDKLAIGIEYTASTTTTTDDNNITITSSEKRIVTAQNDDPYFRFEFRHGSIQQQDHVARTYQHLDVTTCDFDETMICIDPDASSKVQIQGRYISDVYEFLEMDVLKCRNETTTSTTTSTTTCATDEEIENAIQRHVKLRIHFLYEEFDPTRYHSRARATNKSKNKKQQLDSEAVYTIPHDRRMFLLPDHTIKSEIFVKGRFIYHERRHIGSPPVAETLTKILSFGRFEDVLSPRRRRRGLPNNEEEEDEPLAEFFIHLEDETTVEETMYWMPSILDLFGAWGAVFAFFTQLSLGLVAYTYNRWRYHHSFANKSRRLTLRAEQYKKRKGLEKFVYNADDKTTENMLDKIPDLRLFDRDHFDDHGRLCVTPEEFAHPTSLYGELRAYAINEHKKKVKAASLLVRMVRRRKANREAGTTTRTKSNNNNNKSVRPSTVQEHAYDDSESKYDV